MEINIILLVAAVLIRRADFVRAAPESDCAVVVSAATATADAGLAVSLHDEFVWIAKPDFTAGKSCRIEIQPAKM